MVTVATPQYQVGFQQTTQPNGQACRIWEPPNLAAGAPLVLFCHHHTGTEQIAVGAATYDYALIMACVAEGYRVAASNMHGNNWGIQAAVDDLVDLYGMMNTRQAVTKVALFGQSMGAVPATLAVPDGRLPLTGVALLDAVTNLADTYAPAAGFANFASAINTAYGITAGTLSGSTTVSATSLPTTASFPTIGTQLRVGYGTANAETVTTTGASTGTAVAVTAFTKTHASGDAVSDYPTKTAGHDPNLIAGSSFTGVRWRMYSAQSDTVQVNKANNLDLWATKVAAAAEAGTVPHYGGHLGIDSDNPPDLIAFLRRCFT